MERENLYLDPELTINSLADAIGSNRSYLCYAFNENDTTFRRYVNSYRLRHLISVLKDEKEVYGDPECIAYNSGFQSRRLMDKVLKEATGESFYEIKKRAKKKYKK